MPGALSSSVEEIPAGPDCSNARDEPTATPVTVCQ